jgi:hypothetical protein
MKSAPASVRAAAVFMPTADSQKSLDPGTLLFIEIVDVHRKTD